METVIAGLIAAGLAAWLRELALARATLKLLESLRERKRARARAGRLLELLSLSPRDKSALAKALLERGAPAEALEVCLESGGGLHAVCSSLLAGLEALAVDHAEWPGRCGVALFSREGAVASLTLSPCGLIRAPGFPKPRVLVVYDWRSAPPELLELAREEGAELLSLLDLAVMAMPGERVYSLSRLSLLLDAPYDETPEGRALALLTLSLRLAGFLSALGSCRDVAEHLPGARGVISLCSHALEAPPKPGVSGRGGYLLEITPRPLDYCSERVWAPRKLVVREDALTGAPPLARALLKAAASRGACSESLIARSLSLVPELWESSRGLLEKLAVETPLREHALASCRDAPALAELLEREGRKLDLVFVESVHACSSVAGVEPPALLDRLWRVSRRLLVSAHDLRDVPHYAETLVSQKKPVLVVEGLGDHSFLDASRVFGEVLALHDSRSCVLAKTPLSRLSSLALGLRVLEELEDSHSCSKVIAPSLEDLEELARSLGVSLRQAVLALNELSGGSLVVVCGWKRLPDGIPQETIPARGAAESGIANPPLFASIKEALSSLESVAREKWGVELRPYQKRIALYMLEPYVRGYGYEKPAVIALLPTGAGKSLIFQSVALSVYRASRKPVLVVSPLLALIEDQLEGLRRAGVSACRIDGNTAPSERLECLRRALAGEVQLVYSTPEQVEKHEARELVESGRVSYVVLDEAHCAIRWGYTFRPAYSHLLSFIKRVRSEKRWLPVAAFTATLSESELDRLSLELDVLDYEIVEGREVFEEPLELSRRPKVVKSAVLRSNLRLEAVRVPPSRKLEALAEVVKKLREWAEKRGRSWVGVVFVPYVGTPDSRESAERIAEYLEEKLGEEVAVFHGQMSRHARSEVLEAVRSVASGSRRTPRILVATKAFGMGVDIPCIRWVVHYMMSESVEDYYQEVGRGGRDGEEAVCVLLYSGRRDFEKRLSMAARQQPRYVVVASLWRALRDLSRSRGRSLAVRLSTLASILEEKLGARAAPEEVERALHVLSLAGLVDYEVTTGSTRSLDVRFVVVEEGEALGERGDIDRFCLITMRDTEDAESLIHSTVRALRFENLVKLIASFRIAEILADRGEKEAREAITSYFEIGGGFEEKLLAEMKRELADLASASNVYLREEAGRVVVETLASRETPGVIARALAYGVALALLSSRVPPADAVVYTERGLSRRLAGAFRRVAASLEKRGYLYPGRVKVKTLAPRPGDREIRAPPGKTAVVAARREVMEELRPVFAKAAGVVEVELRASTSRTRRPSARGRR